MYNLRHIITKENNNDKVQMIEDDTEQMILEQPKIDLTHKRNNVNFQYLLERRLIIA